MHGHGREVAHKRNIIKKIRPTDGQIDGQTNVLIQIVSLCFSMDALKMHNYA